MLQLSGVMHGDRFAATARVRDAFRDAGAWITDARLFSGMQTVLTFEVAAHRLGALERELTRACLVLDAASRAAIAGAPSEGGELAGTLVVVFADGDPDVKHEIPDVPG